MMADEEPQRNSPTTEILSKPERQLSSPESQDYFDAKVKNKENLLQWMDISITEPEKRTGVSMKIQETFIVYLIESRVTDPDMPGHGDALCTLWRRYSEFELLRNYLDITYPCVIVPPLPEKRVSHAWQKLATDKFDPDFIERRRVGLESFIKRVAAHPVLSKDKMLYGFLRQENSWKEAVYATGFQSKADSKLRAMSASFRLKKPDKRFEELKSYCSELQSNISNILRVRSKLVDYVYGVHKIHGNYGRVFSEWSGIEKEMADGLQSAGHFMDVYASSIDALLEDEEQFADQMKEYYYYGDALRTVCRKQELIQLDLERAEDSLSSKSQQKQQLISGKQSFSFSGMRSKLFGSETVEQKEQRIKQLEDQIEKAEVELKQRTIEAQRHVEEALKDIERFKVQKAKDVKEILIHYAIMQIEQCKKGVAVWENAKECFSKM